MTHIIIIILSNSEFDMFSWMRDREENSVSANRYNTFLGSFLLLFIYLFLM